MPGKFTALFGVLFLESVSPSLADAHPGRIHTGYIFFLVHKFFVYFPIHITFFLLELESPRS